MRTVARIARSSLLGALFVCWVQSVAFATPVVYVDSNGTCSGNTPCFATIQQGVDNATPDVLAAGRVVVFPGVYNESVDISTMGSAVGGPAGDLSIISNTGFSMLASETLSFSETLDSDMTGKIAESLAAPLAASANATLNGVTVMSPAGPAFRTSVPFPFLVDLVDLTVVSPDQDCIFLTVDAIGLVLFHADGCGGSGAVVLATSDALVFYSTFNNNHVAGASIVVSAGDLSIFGVHASMNELGNGLDLMASGPINILRSALSGSDLGEVVANNNGLNGIRAISTMDHVVISDFMVDAQGSPLQTNDNGVDGIRAEAATEVNITSTQATGNKSDGMEVTAGEGVALIAASASDNDINGVRIVSAASLFSFLFTANDNEDDGIVATLTGSRDFAPFGNVAAFLFGVSTDGNGASGTNLTASTAPVVILASTAIMNSANGVLLSVPMASANQVRGGIICSNATGLRLLTNANVAADANWWGDPSGPFHTAKNPGGSGNPVVDATNGGGAGDVQFLPVIDTVTATAPGPAHGGTGLPVTFQFSGGGGTVFLGLQGLEPQLLALGPGAGSPFTVSTDNGTLRFGDQAGSSVQAFLNDVDGQLQVELHALRIGPATVTVTGPCGLSGSIVVDVVSTPAPMMSVAGLLALISMLIAVGASGVIRSSTLHPAGRK